MKNKLLCLLILSLFIFFPFNSFAAIGYADKIIAVVNDDVITLKDFKEYLGIIQMSLAASGRSQSEIKEIMAHYETSGLENLIDDKLLLDAAEKKGLTVREEVIDKRIDELRKRYPSEEMFLKDVVSQGMTLTDVRKKITDQLKIQYIEEIEIRSKVFVSPQDVSLFYFENKEKFQKPESVNLDSIFIAYNDNPEQAKKKAQEALDLLKNPEKLPADQRSFEAIAKKFSESPSIGTIQKGEMLPEIEKVVFDLKVDETSGLVNTDSGIFIFHLKGKTPAKLATLEEVKDKIYDFLFQQRLNELRSAWVNDLKKSAYIEIK